MSSACPRSVAPAVADDAAAIAAVARDVIAAEGRAVLQLAERLDGDFVAAVQRLHACRGRIVVTGMGKSGIIGQKISATFASVGAPSLYLHAAEAVHGDLGRIVADDVVLALSNSGESAELLRLLRPVRALGATLVALTGAARSTLARAADALVWLGEVEEACAMGLVPTASTTAMLAMGDAMAMALGHLRGLSHEAYARLHPGGSLGRRLMRVDEVMRSGAANPVVACGATLRQVLAVMGATPGRPGAASIVAADGRLVGFFTDGDLRRLLERAEFCVDAPVAEVMHARPKQVTGEVLVDVAVQLLRAHQIDQLPVVDAAGRPVGLLDVQDVLAARP